MAKKNWRKALSLLLTLVMVFSLMNVAILAADPWKVGDIAYTASEDVLPEGEIPSLTYWEKQRTIPAKYDTQADPICGEEVHRHSMDCYDWFRLECGKQEHSHRDSCYPVKEAAKVQWKLVENENSAIHLDIHIALTALYIVGDKTYTADVELTEEDYESGRLQITSDAPFSIDSTLIYDPGQRRFEGHFPVGTSADPVYYNIKLVKNVDFNVEGETVSIPMTFERTVHFWDSDNICESIMQNSSRKAKWLKGEFVTGGMDFTLGAASSIEEGGEEPQPTEFALNIQKNVAGIALSADKEYVFGIYQGANKVQTVKLTVAAGQTTAIGTAVLPAGEGYFVQEEGSPAIEGYNLSTSAAVGTANAIPGAASEVFSLNATSAVVFTNSYEKIDVPPVDPPQPPVEPDPVKYTLTVKWVAEDGSNLAEALVEEKEENAAYATVQKSFEGYVFKEVRGDAAQGVMDGDKTVIYVYEKEVVVPPQPPVEPDPVKYTLTVKWVAEDGSDLAEALVEEKEENAAYATVQKSFEGYVFQELRGDAAQGVMNGDKTVVYVYEQEVVVPPQPPQPPVDPVDPVVYYTVTAYHMDAEGNVLAPEVVQHGFELGDHYATERAAIEGYALLRTEGAAVVGEVVGDMVVFYIYAAEGGEVVIPDPEVPLGDEPVNPNDPQGGDPIDNPDEPIDIPDEDVPLADVPYTGSALWVYILLAVFSGMALLALLVTGKKKAVKA